MLRTGRYVKFELHSECELQLMVLTPDGIKRATIDKQAEINAMLIVCQRSADGRLVGIYQDAEIARGVDGTKYAIPPCIVPQRAVMANGGHNLYWLGPGESTAYRLLITIDSVKHLDLVRDRVDIPADKVLRPDYDPAG